MKKILIMAALMATLGAASCKGGKDAPAQEETGWTEISPKELQMSPVKDIADGWMLLAMGNSAKMNAMTISWGSIGELWGMPVMTVYVSGSRYSKAMMDGSKYFTVTAFPEGRKSKDALVYLGSHSYRDNPDKVAEAGLTPEFTELGNPRFAEGNLTFECEMVYHDAFDLEKCPENVRAIYEDGLEIHSFYIGKIIHIYKK